MNLEDTINTLFFPPAFRDTCLRLKTKGSGRTQLRNFFPERYSPELVKAHCAGTEVLAAYNTNAAGFCNYLGLDIDNHKRSEVRAEYNLNGAMDLLAKSPYRAMLEKSNEYGGFHLWIFPDNPMPALEAVSWINDFIGSYTFDPHPGNTSPALQRPLYWKNTLRLPGYNYKRGGWSSVWDCDQWVDVREMV